MLGYIPLLGVPNKLLNINVVLGFNLKLPSKLGICSSSKELASVPEIVPVKPNPLLDVSAEPLTAVSVAKFLPAGAA